MKNLQRFFVIVAALLILSVSLQSLPAAGSDVSKTSTPEGIPAQEETYSPETQGILNELGENYKILITAEKTIDPLEFEKWLTGLKKVASLLPQDVLLEITNGCQDSSLEVVFVKMNSYYAGFAENCKITFNTTRQPPPADLPFEAASEDEYKNDQKILFLLFLHEMAHTWDFKTATGEIVSYSQSYQELVKKEESPSLYAYWSGKTILPEENEEIDKNSPAIRKMNGKLKMVNKVEDFAENFAFYVLLPEYLKENFPLRYNWFKENVFRTEYENNISPIPNCIKSRLTKPITKGE